MTITIRPATFADVPAIAKFIAMAIGDEFSLKNYCGENYLKVLEEIAQADNTQYSFKNSLVAEAEGIVVGAIVGYDGAKLLELRTETFAIIKKHLGITPNMEPETETGEFYLDSIAVLPEYRGRGVAKNLILTLCNKVFSEGHKNVGLLVDIKNINAEKLYHSLGFIRINKKSFLGHEMWHLQNQKK